MGQVYNILSLPALQTSLLVPRMPCHPPKYYELSTQPLPPFSMWMDKQTMKKAENRIIISEEEKWIIRSQKWHGEIMNEYCQLKEAGLKILKLMILTVCTSGKGKIMETGNTSMVGRCLEEGPFRLGWWWGILGTGVLFCVTLMETPLYVEKHCSHMTLSPS